MRNTWLMTKYTLREALSRKIFIAFFGISSFVLLIFALLFLSFGPEEMETAFGQNAKSNIQFDSILDMIITNIKLFIVVPLFGGGLFLSIFSVSSFIPHMLEKGNIDLFLSKPVRRGELLFGKFAGGVLMVLFNIAYLVGGIWLLIGLKFGNWEAGMLWTIVTITFAFALIYVFIILIGILTRSSLLAMMLSYLVLIILSPVLSNREQLKNYTADWVDGLLDGLYYIIPQTSDLSRITTELASGVPIADYQPVIVSTIYIFLILGLSVFIFNKKNY